MTSGADPDGKAITGVPQAIASIMTSPKGSGHSIGNSRAAASPRNLGFSRSRDLADEFDVRMGVDQRLDRLLPVGLIDAVDLGRHLQSSADPRRDFDSLRRTLFRRNAAKESEVVALGRRAERQQIRGQSVMDHADPVHRRHRPALIAGDRHERHMSEGGIDAPELRQVEPTVQCRDGLVGEVSDQRIVQDVDMEMEDVERAGQGADAVEHDDVGRNRILDARVEPQCGVAEGDEPGGGAGVAAGEQGHVVTLPHQLLGQVGDDALGASVQARRAAFVQGSDLRDFHGGSPALPGVQTGNSATRNSFLRWR